MIIYSCIYLARSQLYQYRLPAFCSAPLIVIVNCAIHFYSSESASGTQIPQRPLCTIRYSTFCRRFSISRLLASWCSKRAACVGLSFASCGPEQDIHTTFIPDVLSQPLSLTLAILLSVRSDFYALLARKLYFCGIKRKVASIPNELTIEPSSSAPGFARSLHSNLYLSR